MISNREEERLREELDPAGGGGDPVGGAVVQQEGVGRQVARIAEIRYCIYVYLTIIIVHVHARAKSKCHFLFVMMYLDNFHLLVC